jgi:hypothetical protein
MGRCNTYKEKTKENTKLDRATGVFKSSFLARHDGACLKSQHSGS